MHVHESSTLYNSVAWNSELLISESTNAKRLPWVYPLCVDRSSCFPYRVLTKTKSQTQLITLRMLPLQLALVTKKKSLSI